MDLPPSVLRSADFAPAMGTHHSGRHWYHVYLTLVSVVLFLFPRQGLTFEVQQDSPPDSRISEWIEQLAAPEYVLRQRAERKLRSLGTAAIDELVRVQYESSSVEIRLAARQLLSGLRIRWSEDEVPFVQRLEPSYHLRDDQERLQISRWLAMLEDGVGIVAVCRIARCEPDEIFSKQVVLTLLSYLNVEDEDQLAQLQRALDSPLLNSQRAAVRWLRTLRLQATAPADALKQWMTWVDEERAHADDSQGTPEILMSLRLFVLEQSLRMGDASANQALLAETIPPEAKPAASDLLRVGYLLLDQKEWKLFDSWIAQRFPELVSADPRLAYCHAEALRGLAGSAGAAAAEQKAQAAYAIDRPPADEDQVNRLELLPYYRYQVASQLERRGLIDWALREYERLATGKNDDGPGLQDIAYRRWAELLHDQERDLEAADVLEKYGQNRPDDFPTDDVSIDSVARMNFFRAEHYRRTSDREKQLDHLRQAIDADSTDADVIIAMFRVLRPDEAWSEETRKVLQRAVEGFEKRLREAGPVDLDDDESRSYRATLLNQLAWLISNTEGDFAAAVRYSHESLDLNPMSGGSLDTLGRAYFAAGDLKQAIKYQRRATRLEPYSQQIRRQLDFFEQQLAEQ